MQSFESFYDQMHGYAPFPWQCRLARIVESGHWPDAINLPTSAGKTAIIDVWLWAIGRRMEGVPRRLYYVIDRRALVDAAAEYAQASIVASDVDARVVRLRGGLGVADDEWMLNPSRPTFLSTTVDQIGSRLLGRAYGVGRYSAGIHAGLAGNDALIVLDEAHLIEPLRQTLERIGGYRLVADERIPLPWNVVTMTATPFAARAIVTLDEADRAHPVLRARFGASKLASLSSGGEHPAATIASEAVRLRAAGAEVVGVVVNTVDLARAVQTRLAAEGDTILSIGRSRPIERDAIGAELMTRCGTATRARKRHPLYVIATQTIEVGLDLDFDALVTEIAPISALRQRFGRLDRLGAIGTTRASIVMTENRERPYGKESLAAAARWLKEHVKAVKGFGKVIDLGVDAIAAYAAAPSEKGKDAPILLPVDLDLMFDPEVEIDVAPYLHGERRQSDVHIAWRAALDDLPIEDWADHVESQPPSSLELMPVPLHAARAWLGGRHADVSDLESEPEPEPERRQAPAQALPFVIWDGDRGLTTSLLGAMRAGCTIIVPSSRGGCDRFGWAPASSAPVPDLVEEGRIRLRRWTGDNTRTQHAVPLAEHLKGVGAQARRFGRACGLPEPLVEALDEAGRLHDIGKNDPRFQLLLGAPAGRLLAKSGVIDPRVTREIAGLPRGWRHELASVAQRPDAPPLVRYLVGTHHGRGKPWLPASPDPELWLAAEGANWPALHAEMVARYGFWGVAFLESVVRLADWARSVDEQAAAHEASVPEAV